MHKEQLAEYGYLLVEIEHLTERLKNIKCMQETDIVKASNTHFPYQEISLKIEGVVEAESRKKRKLKKVIRKRITECVRRRIEIEEYISNIDDSRIRMIFELRYLCGQTWKQISMRYGNSGESSPRMAHDRYLKENK